MCTCMYDGKPIITNGVFFFFRREGDWREKDETEKLNRVEKNYTAQTRLPSVVMSTPFVFSNRTARFSRKFQAALVPPFPSPQTAARGRTACNTRFVVVRRPCEITVRTTAAYTSAVSYREYIVRTIRSDEKHLNTPSNPNSGAHKAQSKRRSRRIRSRVDHDGSVNPFSRKNVCV